MRFPRDSIARVLPYYSADKNPLTGYMYGISAFSLEENALYDLAIKQANIALELIPEDGWAHHAIGRRFANSVHCLVRKLEELTILTRNALFFKRKLTATRCSAKRRRAFSIMRSDKQTGPKVRFSSLLLN